MLLASSMGHISLLDWQKKDLITEFHVKEKIRDVKFLHEENMFAVKKILNYFFRNSIFSFNKK